MRWGGRVGKALQLRKMTSRKPENQRLGRAAFGLPILTPAPTRGCTAVEITEEFAVGRQDHRRIFAFQRRLVGVHRAVKPEKVRVLAKGFGKNAIFLAVTLAPRD